MISAIIIDDEQHCITTLLNDLEMFCPTVRVISTCRSGADAIAAIRAMKPQLVFMDIEMPLMNGFEILERLEGERDFSVIFTTAYDKFVMRALRASAIDYLLKPVDPIDLAKAVAKAEQQAGRTLSPDNRINNLLTNSTVSEEQRRIALPSRDGYEFITLGEIIYCKADGGYTEIHLADRKLILSKALGETELLLEAAFFERIHHSVIVNINFVRQFKKNEGLFVIMSNGHQLNVSRSKKQDLLTRLGIK
ncbi:MAG: response regulator transcription factor [Flavobacterium sp.]|nr:MAG: response regulator transcription factor [Flavobacterium sp.]